LIANTTSSVSYSDKEGMSKVDGIVLRDGSICKYYQGNLFIKPYKIHSELFML